MRQGFAGRDEAQAEAFAGPVGHRDAGELGAVVAAQHGRVAALRGDAVEFVDEVVAGDVAFDQAAEAFAGVFVDESGDLDRSAVGGGVELEVDGPDLVRCVSLRRVRGAGAEALASPLLRHAKAFLAPQALDLLVVHGQALAAGVVVGVAEHAPRGAEELFAVARRVLGDRAELARYDSGHVFTAQMRARAYALTTGRRSAPPARQVDPAFAGNYRKRLATRTLTGRNPYHGGLGRLGQRVLPQPADCLGLALGFVTIVR